MVNNLDNFDQFVLFIASLFSCTSVLAVFKKSTRFFACLLIVSLCIGTQKIVQKFGLRGQRPREDLYYSIVKLWVTVCETYQHSDSCQLGDHITNALENVLAVGLLYIYNLMILMYSVYPICAHTTPEFQLTISTQCLTH